MRLVSYPVPGEGRMQGRMGGAYRCQEIESKMEGL
jgi:hypothetical protein